MLFSVSLAIDMASSFGNDGDDDVIPQRTQEFGPVHIGKDSTVAELKDKIGEAPPCSNVQLIWFGHGCQNCHVRSFDDQRVLVGEHAAPGQVLSIDPSALHLRLSQRAPQLKAFHSQPSQPMPRVHQGNQ